MFSLYFTCEFARQKTKKTDILVLMKLCTLKRIFFVGRPNDTHTKRRIHVGLLMIASVCVNHYFISQKYNNSNI